MDNIMEYQVWLFKCSCDAATKLCLTPTQRAYAEIEQGLKTLMIVAVEERENMDITQILKTGIGQRFIDPHGKA